MWLQFQRWDRPILRWRRLAFDQSSNLFCFVDSTASSGVQLIVETTVALTDPHEGPGPFSEVTEV